MNDNSIDSWLRPDPKTARDFLLRFGNDPVLIYRQPDGQGFPALRGRNAVMEALKYNAQGYTIYFVVNQVTESVVKKPKKHEIQRIHAVYGDIDWDRIRYRGQFEAGLAEIDALIETLKTSDTPPTMIIHTGGGAQPIWLIEPLQNNPENAARAEAVGKFVRQRFGGDDVWSIDRVLRLPGTINYPKKDKRDAGQTTALAKLVFDSGPIYALADLDAAWGVAVTGRCRTSDSQKDANKSQINIVHSSLANQFIDDFSEFDARLRSCQQEIDALESAGVISAEQAMLQRTYVEDLIADHPVIVGEVAAGIGALELQTLREVGLAIASIPGGPFSKRDGWLDLLFVCAGCADEYPHLASRFEDIFHKSSEKAGGETKDNEKQWKATIGRTASRVANGEPIKTIGTLIELWSKLDPPVQPSTSESGVLVAPLPQQSDQTQSHQPQAQGQSNTSSGSCSRRSFSTLGDIDENPEPRPWALTPLALYGEVTTIAGPGGFGKTAFAVGLTLEAASGRDFLGHKVFQGPQITLLVSAEESETELRRRFKAAIRHHQIIQAASDCVTIRGTDTEIGSRIELMTLEGKGKVPTLNKPGFIRLEWLLHDTGARIVVLDPLNSFLAGGLNDNSAMGSLVLDLKMIAIKFGAAIILLHHTSKGADLETADAIMGASAIANFSRVAITLVRMQSGEAGRDYPGVPPSRAHQYFRLNYGKTNYALPPDEEHWYWQRSVNLGNATPEYPQGDNVGVVERVDLSGVRAQVACNLIHDRIALQTIVAAPPDKRLCLSARGGTDRNAHKHIQKALLISAVKIPRKDRGVVAKNLVDSLIARRLIEEKEFTDRFRKARLGVDLTDAGRKYLADLAKGVT